MPANAKQPMQRKALGIAVIGCGGSGRARSPLDRAPMPARDRARGTPHHRGHAGDRALAGNRGARASARSQGCRKRAWERPRPEAPAHALLRLGLAVKPALSLASSVECNLA